MRTSDFDYLLPPELIATRPPAERDGSRLLFLDRLTGMHKHAHFREIAAYLPPRSLIVLNDTRVIPARLRGTKSSGGAVELLLTRFVRAQRDGEHPVEIWEGLARNAGRAVEEQPPSVLKFQGGLVATILERHGEGRVLLRFQGLASGGLLSTLEEIGEIPLPPYIEAARKRRAEPAAADDFTPADDRTSADDRASVDDRSRYQTVYASAPGAVAAPTAGLHFTTPLLRSLVTAGHEIARLTLHVGPGTFRPVKSDRPAEHVMDEERFEIPAATARAVNTARASGQPVVAVGTTVVRALEGAARTRGGEILAGAGATSLFLLPGDPFLVVSDLITNFHLPRSTLLMLVAAFAGRERVLDAYQVAIRDRYRFYSYGDAMLISGGRAGR